MGRFIQKEILYCLSMVNKQVIYLQLHRSVIYWIDKIYSWTLTLSDTDWCEVDMTPHGWQADSGDFPLLTSPHRSYLISKLSWVKTVKFLLWHHPLPDWHWAPEAGRGHSHSTDTQVYTRSLNERPYLPIRGPPQTSDFVVTSNQTRKLGLVTYNSSLLFT